MWEYRIERYSTSVLGSPVEKAQNELNKLAAQGWEVVTMAMITENVIYFTLKRLKK